MHSYLDASRIAHIGFIDGHGKPAVLPTGYVRDGNRILIHGSTGSPWFRILADGADACVEVTLLDGLVLARSGFESSFHYRSVVVFGKFSAVADKAKDLNIIVERLFPGRSESLRPMTTKEFAATLVLEMEIVEWSAKKSDGDPHDEGDDINWPVWAGVVPVREVLGTPQPAENLAPELRDVPAYIAHWK
jgi:nitroimidazol reductase NimA-like FMN-containing flavoprotein (pyridoxamine 5'-phosphate oxidase superfamily)